MASGANQIQFERILLALFRYKVRALLAFVVMLVMAVTVTILYPRVYKSEAKLFIRLGRETIHLDPTATTGQTVNMSETREREITSVIELLRGRNLVEKVVDELGVDAIIDEKPSRDYGGVLDWSHLAEGMWTLVTRLTPKPAAPAANNDENGSNVPSLSATRRRELALRLLQSSLECSAPRNSNVITVACLARSPEFAQQKLRLFVATYAEQHLRVNRTTGSYEFFEEQAEKLKGELEAATAKLRDAKNHVGLVSVDSQRSVIEKEIVKLEDNLADSRAMLASSQAKMAGLRRKLSGPPTTEELQSITGSTSDSIDKMREALFKVQVEEQQLLSRFTPDHPAAVSKRQEVGAAEQLLARQEMIVEQSRVLHHKSQLESSEQQYQIAQQRLRQLNQDEVQIVELQRHVDRLEASYKSYLENREQARIDQALESGRISNVNVAQSPSFVAKPASPKPALTLVLGFIAALSGAIGLALLSEFLDSSLKTPSDVEQALELPVLLTIPETRERANLFL
jgi:uncharacterized protein involved in exopolysaccharide biosynthesis